jgi:hypothetical protein
VKQKITRHLPGYFFVSEILWPITLRLPNSEASSPPVTGVDLSIPSFQFGQRHFGVANISMAM